jgi:hypothetical protein
MNIKIGNFEIQTAEGWNDLFVKYGHTDGLRKAMIIAEVIAQDVENAVDAQTELVMKKIEVFKVLTGWNQKNLDALKTSLMYDDMENGEEEFYLIIEKMLHCTDAFFNVVEDEEGNAMADMAHTLTICPYPTLAYNYREKGGRSSGNKKQLLCAPKSDMENISFSEFMSLMTLTDKYLKTGDIKHIDRLLATLYRPMKPKTEDNIENAYYGDKRVKLIDAAVDVRVGKFTNMAKEARQILILWLLSCRAMFVQKYKDLFDTDIDAPDDGTGWAGVLVAMSNGDITRQQSIQDQSAHDVLTNQIIIAKQSKHAE